MNNRQLRKLLEQQAKERIPLNRLREQQLAELEPLRQLQQELIDQLPKEPHETDHRS